VDKPSSIPATTILDLARQRARDIARSPNFTREARHHALAIEREIEGWLTPKGIIAETIPTANQGGRNGPSV